ncbi:MAG: hypothetical protein WB245_02780 [Acidimicrobiia bacterium]
MPSAPGSPLRIGIMCNGLRLPAWQAKAIQHLLDLTPEVEIALLIVPSGDGRRSGRLQALLRDPRHLLWNLYNKGYIERRSRASRGVDLSVTLGAVPTVSCATEPVGRYAERFAPEDLDTIREAGLDLIIRFAFGIIKGEILEAARYGVWSFHHGDERAYRGQPPGFWEIVEGERTMGAILQRITERLDGGTVLHRGTFRVTAHSYKRTRDDAFFGSADFVTTAVKRLIGGDDSVVTGEPSHTDARVRRSPGNWTMTRFLTGQALRFLATQWRGLTRAAIWTVGFADSPIHAFLDGSTPPIHWAAEQGKGRYLADPFPDPSGLTGVVLVEDYRHETHRGVISAVELEGDAKAREVLDTGVHASYPYLIEDDGVIYCIPETYQANQLRLYRAVEFPDRWDLESTFLDGVAALDPTIVHHEGRWWLFCTVEGSDANTKLHVFHAPRLAGPWAPHSLNPVKTNISSSRPGGTPFVHEGTLFRPAQDGSASYGGGVTINRVDLLTPDDFRETEVARIGPPAKGRYRDGIHTLSAQGGRTIVDGRRDTFVFASFMRELRARLSRVARRG